MIMIDSCGTVHWEYVWLQVIAVGPGQNLTEKQLGVYPIYTMEVARNISSLSQFPGTVKSGYRELAYKELPVIRNWFSFPNI